MTGSSKRGVVRPPLFPAGLGSFPTMHANEIVCSAWRTALRRMTRPVGATAVFSRGRRQVSVVTGHLQVWHGALYNGLMPISARNKLRGTIEEVQLGDVMAHVVVRVGDNLIESAITRRSADELKLKKGDAVSAVVKATEVMIQKD